MEIDERRSDRTQVGETSEDGSNSSVEVKRIAVNREKKLLKKADSLLDRINCATQQYIMLKAAKYRRKVQEFEQDFEKEMDPVEAQILALESMSYTPEEIFEHGSILEEIAQLECRTLGHMVSIDESRQKIDVFRAAMNAFAEKTEAAKVRLDILLGGDEFHGEVTSSDDEEDLKTIPDDFSFHKERAAAAIKEVKTAISALSEENLMAAIKALCYEQDLKTAIEVLGEEDLKTAIEVLYREEDLKTAIEVLDEEADVRTAIETNS